MTRFFDKCFLFLETELFGHWLSEGWSDEEEGRDVGLWVWPFWILAWILGTWYFTAGTCACGLVRLFWTVGDFEILYFV